MSLALADLFSLALDSPQFRQALVHPSFANEQRLEADNQRLEFLGDAVLQFVASQWLYREFPNADEGELTRRRAQLVNSEALAGFAREVGLEEALRLGKGADAHGLRGNTGVLADAVEALIAATFLDRGVEVARQTCERLLVRIAEQTAAARTDAKSDLQEAVQAEGLDAPVYRLIESGGPAHEPWFEVCVLVEGAPLGQARGRNKRGAEREAARLALEALPAFFRARRGDEP